MLLKNLAANVVGNVFRNCLPVASDPRGQRQDGFRYTRPYDQFQQTNFAKVGDYSRCFSLDVSVDQVAHVRLIGLEVDGLATCLPNDLTQLNKVVDILLDRGNLGL